MTRLFVRHTYWPLSNPRRTTSKSRKLPAAYSPGTERTANGASGALAPSAWTQTKRHTYGGQRVQLRLDIQCHRPLATLPPAEQPLAQRHYQFRLAAVPPRQAYRLYGYVPFSSRDEGDYRRASSAALVQQMLGRALISDLATLAPCLGQKAQLAYALRDFQLLRTKSSARSPLRFDLSFSVPMLLPEYIGIGYGVDDGYGLIRLQK